MYTHTHTHTSKHKCIFGIQFVYGECVFAWQPNKVLCFQSVKSNFVKRCNLCITIAAINRNFFKAKYHTMDLPISVVQTEFYIRHKVANCMLQGSGQVGVLFSFLSSRN